MKYNFVEKPNLPQERVSDIIIGRCYADILKKSLLKYGVNIIESPLNMLISPNVSAHADLSMLHLGGNKLIISKNICESAPLFVNILTNRGAHVLQSSKDMSGTYEHECALCACLVGKHFFHRLDYTDSNVMEGIEDKLEFISVKQGYSKCSICVVDDRSIISSDKGIIKAAVKAGLNGLLISPGFISLAGYDTGFIGGSSFKISKTQMAFTGVLDNHPDKDMIENFLYDCGVKPLYLTKRPIFDIGSGIPIFEYVDK